MAAGKDIHSRFQKKVRDEKGWPCERQEMGAEEFWSDEHAKWINEEGEEDGCGGLNEELGEIEENLKRMEFGGMEGGMEDNDGTKSNGSLNTRNFFKVCNFELHYGDLGLILGLNGVIIISRWRWFGCGKPTWRGFIFVPAWFCRIVGVRTSMNDPFVVLVRLWNRSSKKDSLRGLGGIFGGFRRLPVFLFLVVEELLIGSNPGCILGLWASHYIPIKFSTIPAFIVA